MASLIKRILAFIVRNEHRLGPVLFLLGFLTDIITVALVPLRSVLILFGVYLVIAFGASLLGHMAHAGRLGSRTFARALPTLASLFVQYLVGAILSGCLIFFARSGALVVSWPFLFVLGLIILGNELFRRYRMHLVFQTVLLFLALYAYMIFALPLALLRVDSSVFLFSTGAALLLFALFLVLLWRIGRERFSEAFAKTMGGVTLGTIVFVGAYFTGLVPPIPLALSEVGVYNRIERSGGSYVLYGTTQPPWWQVWAHDVPHVPGTPLYVYSSVFAPVAFSASITHEWQRYDEVEARWVRETLVAFPITGGREGGYRGYSIKDNPAPGRWRVSIATMSGQVIGRMYFNVEETTSLPSLLQSVR
jgi:hypothetical protein